MSRPEGDYTFTDVAQELVELQLSKNHDYGGTFGKLFAEYGTIVPIIHLEEKLQRIKTLTQAEAKVKGESCMDSLRDLACYAIMTIVEIKNSNG